MKRWVIYIGTFLLLICCGSSTLSAQESGPSDRYLESDIQPQSFDRDRWQSLTEGLDYREEAQRSGTSGEDQPAASTEPAAERSGISPEARILIARILMVGLGALLIAVLVWSLLGYQRQPSNQVIKAAQPMAIDIRQVEENLHASDLEKYILQAQEEGHYPLAIRLYYLAILKALSLHKAIKWKPDKTNGEYLREMRASEDYDTFRSLTFIFERLWYADRNLSQAEFSRLAPRFRQFLDHISIPTQTTSV